LERATRGLTFCQARRRHALAGPIEQGRDDAARQRVIVPNHNPQQRADWTSISIERSASLHQEVGVWSAETVLVCALTLLGRSPQSFPAVQFVEKVPPGVSPFAVAYTQFAERRIVLVASTSAFTRARGAIDRCGDIEAIREIAGILAHEEWHLRYGRDEQGAYTAQLIALMSVGAGPNSPLYHKVFRSKQAVSDASKRAAEARAVARGPTP
jgi:hypothetical protein